MSGEAQISTRGQRFLSIWNEMLKVVTSIVTNPGITSIISSFVLFAYFLIFILLALATLSAHQLQFSIQSYQTDGNALSISKVVAIEAELARQDKKIFEIEERIYTLNKTLADITPSQATLQNSYRDELISSRDKLKDVDLVNSIATRADILSKEGHAIQDFINNRKFLQRLEQDLVFTVFDWIPGSQSIALFRFSEMPPSLLTMLLVLIMGALGGTIHLTKLFLDRFREHQTRYKHTVKSVMYYVFRPMLGAVTAFAVFVLAKAGVLVITVSSGPDAGAQLSPYFVAFLGLITGILAEEALNTIRDTGSAWFSSTEAHITSRWALEKLIAEKISNPRKAELSRLIGVPQETLEMWLSGKDATPPEAQTLIAASVRKPIREIFSDLRLPQEKDSEE